MSLDHTHVEAADLVGRYRAGRLGPEEVEAFEEHYLHCARCLDQLEADAGLSQALRSAAAEDALRVARPLTLLVWLVRLSRSRQAAALLGVLLVALVAPLAWQQRRLARLLGERDTARAAAAEALRAASAVPEARAELERARLEARTTRQDLERERRSRAELEERLERERAPQANTPIVRLSPLRSLGGEPADRLRLGEDAGWVVLALELSSADFPSYRVRLERAGAPAPVVSQDGLVANAEGSLALSLHASMLAPGDYEALVEGRAADGTRVPAGRFTLRVAGGSGR